MFRWPIWSGCVPITHVLGFHASPGCQDSSTIGERLRDSVRTENPRHAAAPGEDIEMPDQPKPGKKPGKAKKAAKPEKAKKAKKASRFQLGNWRVRTRLVALILIPTFVAVLLAGIQLTNSVDTAAEFRRATQAAELEQRLGMMAHELGKERALSAWWVADHRRSSRLSLLRDQRDIVDSVKGLVLTSIDAIDEAHPIPVRTAVADMARWLRGLDGLRASTTAEGAPARASIRIYSDMIDVMEGLRNELGAYRNSTALSALHRVKEEVSRQQIILLVALVERKLGYDDLTEFLGSWNRQQAELKMFERQVGVDDYAFYKTAIKSQVIDRGDAMRQRALSQMRQSKRITDLDITTRRDLSIWFEATTASLAAMRKVEDRLATSVVTETKALSDAEQRNVFISGALILVLLALVLLITSRVAGSLVRPLRVLRMEALEVAESRLPETVRALRESGDGAVLPEVAAINVHPSDEIGEVARA